MRHTRWSPSCFTRRTCSFPRLRGRAAPRKGIQSGQFGAGSFRCASTITAANSQDVVHSGGGCGVQLTCTACDAFQPAVCLQKMARGQHKAEITIVKSNSGWTFVNSDQGGELMLGVSRLGLNVDIQAPHLSQQGEQVWLLYGRGGNLWHAVNTHHWEGIQPFGCGDVVGLLLECDVGTLAVEENDRRLGVAITGLTGELRWAVTLCKGCTVRVR